MVGIAANMTWGLAFLVPVLLAEFNPVAITVGRYLCYGLLSLVIALVTGNRLRYPRAVWGRAVLFAVTGNIGYYFLVVQGVELVGAPVVAVIIGTLPVTVALYGNWSHRDVPFRLLALPLVLIACGLVVVNAVEVDWSGVGTRSLPAQLLGVACALAALALWTWFGVANSTFLKANPGISSAEWSTVIGVVTLALSLVVTPVLLSGRGVAAAGSAADLAWWPLVVGSVVLGLLVSWGGTLLWNRALAAPPRVRGGAAHRLRDHLRALLRLRRHREDAALVGDRGHRPGPRRCARQPPPAPPGQPGRSGRSGRHGRALGHHPGARQRLTTRPGFRDRPRDGRTGPPAIFPGQGLGWLSDVDLPD
nr:hypothetical protein GCM10020241_07650 [Streptoalloteichus tenebrarius]